VAAVPAPPAAIGNAWEVANCGAVSKDPDSKPAATIAALSLFIRNMRISPREQGIRNETWCNAPSILPGKPVAFKIHFTPSEHKPA
jgi:hypothetical protein